MDHAEYDTSRELLFRAVRFVGDDSRRGGEFKLWLAQALQAVGDADGCCDVLKSLKHHKDSDVRHVAKELLYIATAPRLSLNSEDFVNFRASDTAGLSEKFANSKGSYKVLNKPKAPYSREVAKKSPYVIKPYQAQPDPSNSVNFLLAVTTATVVLSSLILRVKG